MPDVGLDVNVGDDDDGRREGLGWAEVSMAAAICTKTDIPTLDSKDELRTGRTPCRTAHLATHMAASMPPTAAGLMTTAARPVAWDMVKLVGEEEDAREGGQDVEVGAVGGTGMGVEEAGSWW